MEERIALATPSNRTELMEIWDECFGDDPKWRDWFFDTRFDPENTVCFFDREGRIASDLQLYHYPVNLRGQTITADALLGVATRTDSRGRGYMGRILRHAMALSHQKGRLLMFHSPVVITQYVKYGHLASADIQVVRLAGNAQNDGSINISHDWDVSSMLSVYDTFSATYSQMVHRDENLMALRVADSIAGDMQLIMVRDAGGLPAAYAIVGKEKDKYTAIECCWIRQSGFEALLGACLVYADGTPIELTLPIDAVVPPKFVAERIEKPYFALRTLDVAGLLKTLDIDSDITISVSDDILPHNNGCFSVRGTPSTDTPAVHMDAGAFSQWICGYRSLSRLSGEEGQVTIRDPKSVQKLDNLLPVLPCYLFERY